MGSCPYLYFIENINQPGEVSFTLPLWKLTANVIYVFFSHKRVPRKTSSVHVYQHFMTDMEYLQFIC